MKWRFLLDATVLEGAGCDVSTNYLIGTRRRRQGSLC